MKISHRITTLFITVFSCLIANGSTVSERIIFDGKKCSGDWTVSTPADGVSLREDPEGLGFVIEQWKEGKDGWPRLVLSGGSMDLSDYSQVRVEIQNPTDEWQDIVSAVGSEKERLSDAAAQIPPRSTHVLTLDISDGVNLDQSNVQFINLYLSHPVKNHTYVLKKIYAVKNPDFPSGNEAVRQRYGSLRNLLERAASGEKNGKSPGLASTEKLMEAAKKQLDARRSGFLGSVEKLMERIEGSVSREYLLGIGKACFVWTSPLGLPMRKNTLPQPGDAELDKINRLMCRNDYKAICVNISAGASPRSVSVDLRNENEKGIMSLRPTLFVTARDGSETADAIGDKCMALEFEIPAFETRQFILWVDTKLDGVEAKPHSGVITIKSGGETQSIPVMIDVADIRLPVELPILIYNWAYFFEPRVVATVGLEAEAVKNLRDYGLNTWVLNYTQIPLPKLDAEGRYAGLENTKAFHKVMDLLKGNERENFILWLGFERDHVKNLFSKQEIVNAYFQDLKQLLDQYHVGQGRRYIQFVDEPKLDYTVRSLEWMRKIQSSDSGIRFFDNGSSLLRENEQLRKFLTLVNVYSPNWDALFERSRDDIALLQSEGVNNLGFYRCRMGRNNRGVNIYEYYRIGFWRLMRYGMGNIGFWTYNAGHGEDVWDGRTGRASGGTVVYSKDGRLLSSRRWELFREGLSDYRLMLALQESSDFVDTRNNRELLELNDLVLGNLHQPGEADDAHDALIKLAIRKRETADAGR